MAKTSPTQRTLKWLKQQGYEACIVERYIPRAQKRIDAFGFGDILAMWTGMVEKLVLVQTTSGSHHADHKTKILGETRARLWLQNGGHILLISWRKLRVKDTPKLRRWEPRVEWITEEMFDGEEDETF